MPGLVAALSKVLGQKLSAAEFIPLPETDKLWDIYGKGYAETRLGSEKTYRRFFKSSEWPVVSELTACAAEGLSKDEAFLLLGQSKICGAVREGVGTLLSHLEEVIDLDGDGLRLVATDMTQGLMVDRNPEDPVWYTEIAVWGEQWSQLFASSGLRVFNSWRSG